MRLSSFHRGVGKCGLAAAALLVFAGAAQAQQATAAAPTFTKDVAPIFQEKCESCHRPDSIAPMSLRTYEETRPWAKSIRTRVSARQMPPWHIDKGVGIQQFKYDRSLSDSQIDTIVRWIDAGAPKGDAKDMPPARNWGDEQAWSFAPMFGQTEPDLIVRSTPYTVTARGQDSWWKPTVDIGLTEPRWVRAIEIRPSTVKGRRVTHHSVAYLQQEEKDNPAANAVPLQGGGGGGPFGAAGVFMEWAVGKQGEIMRPESGKLLLPGSQIHWDIHYSTAGEEVNTFVEMGIYLYPKGQEPKYRQSLMMFPAALGEMDIQPNSISVTQGNTVMRSAGRIESFQPHMHLRGKAMSMEAILPNGQTQMLSHVNNFNFNWHNSYVYADDAAPLLPKGTIVRVTAWHDNTAALASNPDPNQWVGWGDRTVDEMAHAWVNVTYMSDADYEAEVAKRRAAGSTRTGQQQ
jgi:hypothetical protein